MRHAVEWGLLLAALAADASPSAAAVVGDGQRAYDNGRFEEARRIWAPLAEAGDAEAQVRLGLLFDLGQGVPEDLATAYMWYRRAAEAGLAQAQFNVAVMQDSGVGGPRNAVEAARWYAKAAAQGHHRAQYNLAQLYSSGDGVPRDIAQAKAWYRVAAHGGLTAAADKLAGIERDARSGTSPFEPEPVAPPVLTVNAPTDVSEDAGEIVVRLELSRPVDTPVTVVYSTLDGEALDGFDYRAKQGVLSLSWHTFSSELHATLLGDDQAEADETFYFFITTIPQNVIVPEKWTTVIIHDEAPAGLGADGERKKTSELRRSQTDEATTRAGSAAGTAGQDAGIRWSLVERAHLATPQPGLSAEPPARLPAAADPPVLTVDAPTGVSEDGGQAVVSLELSKPADGPVTVIYSTLDGEALDGSDYRAKKGVLWLPSDTLKSELRATLLDDDRAEADETFYFFLSTIPQNVDVAERWTTVTIHDDEQPWRRTSASTRTPPATSSQPRTSRPSASTALSP